MLDPNLPRWLYASVSKFMKENTGNTITFFEGTDRDDDPKDGVEFRMDGPRYSELSRGYWNVWIAVNFLVSHTLNNREFHKIHTTAGVLTSALDNAIPVFKFGNGPNDNPLEKIGCLTVIHDKFNRIQVNHLGQVEKDLRLQQATIEARYEMYLQED